MHRPLGLRTKLVVLLLAFGLLPLATFGVIGFTVSRATIIRQADGSLGAIARGQAAHLATELRRERLLLRTIAGQLPPHDRLRSATVDSVAHLLVQALPEGGVFDGLRIVTMEGTVLASVALRNTAPHWPDTAPATDWTTRQIEVHREDGTVVAYLVAVPFPDAPGAWLEGHVRQADFARTFALPQHLEEGVESAVVEGDGQIVFAMHAHSRAEMAGYLQPGGATDSSPAPPALIARVPIATTDWIFVAALPLDVALAPLARLRNTAIVGAGGLVLVIVLTGMFASRSVTTPLRQLAAAAGQFGREGRYEPVAPRGGSAEGRTLISAFGTMAANLQRSREDIERLHARDLERAQQLATVGELASGVAHEIRNPLTGVRGALELAVRGLAESEPNRALLEEAQQQLARIEAATTQLLRYARPAEPREVTVDANLLIERAVHVVTPQATNAKISLRPDPAPEPVAVRVDPELMVQVLVNLMLNGIDAMGEGGTLTVWTERCAPGVRIGVRDTGPGVPPEARAGMFRPFFTTKHHGTGLGLPISQQIVSRHGGTLHLEDTPGGGATFVVDLPPAPDGDARDHTS